MSGHPAGPAVTPSTLPDVIQRASTSTAPSRDTEDTKQADDAADVGVGFSSFSSSLIVATTLPLPNLPVFQQSMENQHFHHSNHHQFNSYPSHHFQHHSPFPSHQPPPLPKQCTPPSSISTTPHTPPFICPRRSSAPSRLPTCNHTPPALTHHFNPTYQPPWPPATTASAAPCTLHHHQPSPHPRPILFTPTLQSPPEREFPTRQERERSYTKAGYHPSTEVSLERVDLEGVVVGKWEGLANLAESLGVGLRGGGFEGSGRSGGGWDSDSDSGVGLGGGGGVESWDGGWDGVGGSSGVQGGWYMSGALGGGTPWDGDGGRYMSGVLEDERVWDGDGSGGEWWLGRDGFGGQDQAQWLWERRQGGGQGEWGGELDGFGGQGLDWRQGPGEGRMPVREVWESRKEKRHEVERRGKKTLKRERKVGVWSSTVLVLTVDHGSKWMRECAAYYDGVC